jgi:hypothetical protein
MATGRQFDLPYMVEQWDDADSHVEELIALTGDYRVACAISKAIYKSVPHGQCGDAGGTLSAASLARGKRLIPLHLSAGAKPLTVAWRSILSSARCFTRTESSGRAEAERPKREAPQSEDLWPVLAPIQSSLRAQTRAPYR